MAAASLYVLLGSFLIAWLSTSMQSDNSLNSSTSSPQRILLVTAHPDDECMFFAPTILALVKVGQLHSLCLSTGNMDGLGSTRTTELEASLDVLGVAAKNRRVVDHPLLQDNITTNWNPQLIAQVVGNYVDEHEITTILTFDNNGISEHPNHSSLPKGLKTLLSTCTSSCPKVYNLISAPLSAKYIGILAPSLAKLDLYTIRLLYLLEDLAARVLVLVGGAPPMAKKQRADEMMPVFVAGFADYILALKAMLKHNSQLVWFRWLYVAFSRYMWVNEWVAVH
ncbi:LmbE-like protein [Mycena floridula]|nr:LmbE-like protein [Mycena floridula]